MAIARPKENPTIGMSGTGTQFTGLPFPEKPKPGTAPDETPDTRKAEDK